MKITEDHIETPRLIIRKFKHSDQPGFLEFMLNPSSTEFLNFSPEQKTKIGAIEVLNWVIGSYDTETPIHSYAIELKEKDNQYIGSVGLSELDEENSFECYYSINEKFLRKGYATEAMSKLIEIAFSSGVEKISAYCHPSNIASKKLALRLGMKYLGKKKRKDLPSEACYFLIESK